MITGNPAGIRELARHWLGQAAAASAAAETLRSAAGGLPALRLQGDFAPKVASAVGDLPSALASLARGYRGCGSALDRYADRLEWAQALDRSASSDRDTAARSQRSAEWDLDALAPGWDAHADNPTGLRSYLVGKEPALAAVTRREQASRDVSLADSLARQASQLRGEAEQDCARDIERALEDSGLKNRSWLRKAGSWLATAFTTWDGFVKLCTDVSLVLGVVALFLSGPFALVLLAASMVVVVDKALKLARGEMSWKEAAFELGLFALSRFGGRALAPAFRRLGRTKAVTGLLRRSSGRFGVRNLVHRARCVVTGHPVDVATGKVFTDATDLELPGFVFDRVWYSTSTHAGPLGHGWHHRYDAALLIDRDELVYRTPDGRHVELLPLYPGTQWFDRQERITLYRSSSGDYRITDSDGLTWHFLPDGSLAAVTSRAGRRIALSYGDGRLTTITDAGGREFRFEHSVGRIVALTAPHPDEPGERFTVARYAYDSLGNLTSVTDALGQVFSYSYEGHLLTRETDRNGLSFHFEYDADARCLHTWGDGGIYDHHLTYAPGETTVTNSLGHRTSHEHENGLVTRSVDALGAVHVTEYDYQQPISSTDPLGRTTTHQYDHRGNRTQTTTPDGAVIRLEFGEHDQPVRATDAVGGTWAWTYDDAAQVTGRRDPLGAMTRFRYTAGHLSELTDAVGSATRFTYDDAGCLIEVRTGDGAASGWRRDVLGRPVAARDALGNEEVRRFDLLGRIVAVDEPDGNHRDLEYDPEGNVVRVVDALYDVSLGYRGMGRLVSRTQGGTTVRFEYDTEEHLTGVVNENGHAYTFTFGPTGEVMTERGLDGVLRLYERDVAGRVVSLRRPSGTMTRYAYDAADRLVSVAHSDGTGESFSYRADGALMSAENVSGRVVFERDVLGRVTREFQDEHWVAGQYDALGRRVRLSSSLGAEVTYGRDAMGDVTAMTAEQGGAAWSARFERDALGQELARSLPGGVEARWHRDRLGRPVRHEVTGPGGVLHDRTYEWGVDARLLRVIDAVSGPTDYEHDVLGQLVSATHAGGRVDLRMPDAVGNLFRTRDRSDREYGPAGQLLSATDDSGRRTRYTYDAEGSLIRKEADDGEAWHYRWGADGLLHQVTRPDGEIVSFTYDPLARRRSKTFRGEVTRWVWSENAPLHEWTEGALTTSVYADGDLGLLSVLQSDRALSVFDHGLGSVAVADDRDPVLAVDLDVWGTASGSTTALPGRWPGQYEDAETGLHYNRFRYYDPDVGAYLSQDPLRLGGGLRPYGYPTDPLSAADPLGLQEIHLNPADLYFSQRSVNHNVDEYIKDMRKGQWDWARCGPLRVMRQGGNLVSYDNRRLYAAQVAGLPSVPVVMVEPDELSHIPRVTWEQAFQDRFNDDRNLTVGGAVPCGGLKGRPMKV